MPLRKELTSKPSEVPPSHGSHLDGAEAGYWAPGVAQCFLCVHEPGAGRAQRTHGLMGGLRM